MELLFGRRRSPEELLRQNQRALSRAVRELERERQKLEAQEKKIIVDIKKMAKQGQMDAVQVLAKALVRTRRYERKFIAMRANVQGVALRVQTLRSHSAMATAMRGVTRAMATMNRQLKLPQIQRILQEFQKQSELMDMKEELMNDAIDDALGDEDDEDESPAAMAPPQAGLTREFRSGRPHRVRIAGTAWSEGVTGVRAGLGTCRRIAELPPCPGWG
ncbi:charged multivesicular body protein 2a [Geospiza fortis]|uniref:Charged multivesicular body protein 2a n=1 Tax=Geospiza fortis TaxID=48883 RepID=A0A8N5F0P4_GEOFO|nr:charged multivesicular body protein 2a [Geospiza fortis]